MGFDISSSLPLSLPPSPLPLSLTHTIFSLAPHPFLSQSLSLLFLSQFPILTLFLFLLELFCDRCFYFNYSINIIIVIISLVKRYICFCQRFPLFADAHPLNCTIGEGEVLFMPAFWWHEVQSRPNVKAGRNLAVNFWYVVY